MALKNLFDMVKADRYTADGREELIKAQEAETEDKVYQIGEISQKTGLQKTANGWVKPKNGKQPGAKNAETNYGKVEKKDGKWGVQQKLGKGSQFIEHKDKKDATEALKNYTEGYNTTARSKQDPHSDEARQVKQWNKETEKIRKENRAERRAEHAAQFQNQPTLSQTDGKGNKVEIKITESKGGGFYVDKYVNGKKVGINNANTRESAEAKAKSMMEQHMADPDYRAESKPERYDYRSAMEKNPTSAFDFKGAVSHSMPMNQTDYDELEGLSKFMKEEKATYQNALKNRAQALVDGHKGSGDWFPEKEQAIMKIAKAVGFDDELHTFIAEENRGYDLGYSEDAAPSLSEIVDRVYNIGEISEKTGLQKTAQGWRPVKKGAAGTKQPDESARIAASKEARAKKSQELGQKAAGDFAKYKDLPPVQRKDALGAASHEGISIGTTQRSMEGMGWDLIQADDKVNVYGKPDGSKAIMKHDGKKITEVSYEAPGSKSAESKPDAADQRDQIGGEIKGNLEAAKYYFDKAQSFSLTDPSFKTYMAKAKEYNDKAKAQADDNGFDWEEMHNRGITRAVDEFARQNKSKATDAYSWIKREAGDSAPRQLTGDCRIRIRKEKPALTGDTKIRVRK